MGGKLSQVLISMNIATYCHSYIQCSCDRCRFYSSNRSKRDGMCMIILTCIYFVIIESLYIYSIPPFTISTRPT